MNKVSVQLVDTVDGRSAVVMLGGRVSALHSEDVAVIDGVLRVALPLDIEAPAECVEVTRFHPATADQVAQAVNELPTAVLDRLLLRESAVGSDEPWPAIVRRAVVAAVLGDTGED